VNKVAFVNRVAYSSGFQIFFGKAFNVFMLHEVNFKYGKLRISFSNCCIDLLTCLKLLD